MSKVQEAIKYLNQYALLRYQSPIKAVSQKAIQILESEPEPTEYSKEKRELLLGGDKIVLTCEMRSWCLQAFRIIDRLSAENKEFRDKLAGRGMSPREKEFIEMGIKIEQLQAELKAKHEEIERLRTLHKDAYEELRGE